MIILVVEDNPLVAAGLEAVLANEGHDVLGPATTVTDALALAEETPPNFALVDISLGAGGNGTEAARELRRRWGTHCVFLSAQSEKARAARETAVGYLQKPVTAATLLQAMDTLSRLAQGEDVASLPQGLEVFQTAA